MADDMERSPVLRWPSALLMLLLAWGIIASPGSLESRRPPTEGGALLTPTDALKVPARLWQDPLATAADAVKDDLKKQTSDRTARCECEVARTGTRARIGIFGPFHESPGKDSDCYLIMPVLISASPFDVGAEIRIRQRYAVLSALALADFVPLDSQHLRYFFPQRAQSQRDLTPNPSEVIPFEWFRKDEADKPTKYICIVWASEDVLGAHPLQRLGALLKEFKTEFHLYVCKHLELHGLADPILSVLGPANSDMLRGMVREAQPDVSARWATEDVLRTVTLFSTQATWQEEWDRYAKDTLSRPDPKVPARRDGIKVQMEIGRDDQLVRVLTEELDRRGLEPGDRIALLGEWDTEYGRGMVRKFAERLRGNRQHGNLDLRCYYYLRGLDGKLTESIPTNEQPASPEDSPRMVRRSPARPGMAASGRTQVDYLSRLVEEIHADGDLKFIGILGSDVYDKILLMRAIRPIAPQAICFTTDLDARLLDPSEYRSTHNLLIASHYSLRLDPGMTSGGQVPPFRDSYQTSLARGCLHALSLAKYLGPDWVNTDFMKFPDPVLYELGRNGPFLLQGPDQDDRLARATDIAGWVADRGHLLRLLAAAAAVFAFVVLLRPMYWASRARRLLGHRRPVDHRSADDSAKRRFPMHWIGFTAVTLYAGLFALVISDVGSESHEPFLIFEGISTWPTEFIRLTVCVICLYATFAILRSSDRNARKIIKEFGLHRDAGDGLTHRPPRHRGSWFAGWLNADRLWSWDRAGEKLDGIELWADYLRDGSPGARVRRTLPFVLVHLAFALVLTSLLGGPEAPVRGALNRAMDGLLLWTGVLSLIWILYFVFDATRLCDHFIRLLFRPESDSRIEWPEGLRRNAALRQGLGEPGVACDSLAHLVTIRIAEARTEAVDKFIYFPSVALLLMLLSRYNVFDNWDWPTSLILVFLLSSATIVYCALAMRRNAERLRAHALEEMRRELGQVRARGSPPEMVTEEQIQAMIEEVESTGRGAFCRMADNPVIRAVLIPFGGVGALTVLDQLRPYL